MVSHVLTIPRLQPPATPNQPVTYSARPQTLVHNKYLDPSKLAQLRRFLSQIPPGLEPLQQLRLGLYLAHSQVDKVNFWWDVAGISTGKAKLELVLATGYLPRLHTVYYCRFKHVISTFYLFIFISRYFIFLTLDVVCIGENFLLSKNDIIS